VGRAAVSSAPVADTRFIYFDPKLDPDFLHAIGEVSICHGQLDHMLRMTIKTLTAVSVEEALDATERATAAVLRKRVHKLARKRLGDGAALVKLEAILERCRRASASRNDIIHSVVGRELDREPLMRRPGNKWGPPPTVDELRALAVDLQTVAKELNDARLHGFLDEALKSRKAPP
jgi:hypothetical protein